MSDREALDANAEFYRAFRERDYPGMDALWARETVVACIHPGTPALYGRGPVLASWRAIMSSDDSPRVKAVDETANVFGDTAIVTCTERVGRTRVAATNIFIRERGVWRLLHHHASPVGRDMVDERTPDRSLN